MDISQPMMPVPALSSKAYPIVSIIIPCRNEAAFIASCLDSVLGNDFPKEQLEILVVDGLSEDGTREILDGYARNNPFLEVLENPKRVTPVALNLGIKKARGAILMRMDAHARYDSHYIRECVRALGDYSADCVGGVWKIIPRSDSAFGRGVAQALAHPFGVGNAAYRYAGGGEPRWVDTVPYFCMRKWKFEEVGMFNERLARGEDMEFHMRLSQVGMFNEHLTRGQDMEFSLRLKRAGGRTLLLPNVASYYYARSDLRAYVKHNWDNGVWAILPFAYSDIVPVAGRHLVPLAFMISVLVVLGLGYWDRAFLWIGGGIVSLYGLLSLGASVQIAWRRRDPRYLFLMPITFALLHWSYGLGSLWGFVRLVTLPEFWKRLGWPKWKHAPGRG